MKKKEFEKFKNHSAAELKKDIAEKKEKLFLLMKDLSSGKLKNVHELRVARKDIARMLTLVNNKPTAVKAVSTK